MVGIVSTNHVTRPHAVMFPFPAQGHVRPLMQLGLQLNRVHGFKVTFVTTSHIFKRLTLQEASVPEDGLQFMDLQEGFPDDMYTLAKFIDLCYELTTLGPLLQTFVEKLLLNSGPTTCMMSDLGFPAVQQTAAHLGIPHVGFGTHCAVALSGEVYLQRIVEAGLLPLPPADPNMPPEIGLRDASWPVSAEDAVALNRPVTCVPGMYPMAVGELFSGVLTRDISTPGVKFLSEYQAEMFRTNAWNLVNTFHELEAPVIEALQNDAGIRLTAIGPLVITPTTREGGLKLDDKQSNMSSFWSEETKCLDWLDEREPGSVVYVSLGSLTHLTTKEFEEFLLGLEDSQIPFIFVLRKDLVKDRRTNNLQQLPAGFEERTKDRGLIVNWVPQLKVLAHAATGGFLSHCGWNSLVESMAMGVPILGFPYFADQLTINRYIVNVWENGWELEKKSNMFVERQEVARKVRALMAEESTVRDAALKWKDLARQSVKKGGSSHNNIAGFVADMYKRAAVAELSRSE